MARIDHISDEPRKADLPLIEAMMGTPQRSEVTVKAALDEFYVVASERVIGMSKDQLRKHRNPLLKTTKAFVKVVGNKPLRLITSEDMFPYRRYLADRVAKTRPPLSEAWIREKIMAPEALDRLNTDARLITIGMINTGYSPSEGAGLLVEEIVLTANVPHIIIQANSIRYLKTAQSQRCIPFTGISLEAFREARNSFPAYAKNSAILYATVNKFFAERGLRETPDHALYNLRHAMEDRTLRAEIDVGVRMHILGHRIKRERYGEGGGLAHVHGLLDKIAL